MAFAANGASIAFTSSRLTASKYDASGSGSFVFNVTSSSTRRILRLHRTQVAPRAERALRDVARRDERQRSDRVLVGDRRRLFLASAERFLQERLHRRASVERRERNHADRLGRFLFRFLDELVSQVLRRERDRPAVVVLDDLVLPEEARRAVEERTAEDQALRDEALEQPEPLRLKFRADHHLSEFLAHLSALLTRSENRQ